MKKIIIGSVLMVGLILAGIWYFSSGKNSEKKEDSFSINNSSGAENLQEAAGDNIRIQLPLKNASVGSPLKIKGLAKGWYFEGSFAVKLINENGKTLAQGIASAKGDWMVDEFVPFEAELIFDSAKTRSGKIIFEKSNPSGLPENDRLFMLPVKFIVSD